MIPWVIALVLSFAACSFTPDHPWEEAYDPSGEATVSQAGEEAQWPGRSSTTPVKLPSISWAVAGLARPGACLHCVDHGNGLWVRQSGRGLVHGRAPPAPAAA